MPGPLDGRTVVITRSPEDSAGSAELFTSLGAKVICFPAVAISRYTDFKELDKILQEGIDMVIFTSVNSVKYFQQRITETGIAVDYNKVNTAAVGVKTAAECERQNITINICPERFSAEGLLAELSNYDIKGKRVLIPSSEIARDQLADGLRNMGAIVSKIPVYRVTLPPEPVIRGACRELKEKIPDLYIFASPSAYRNFLEIMRISEVKEFFKNSKISAIGPVTKKEIENSGITDILMPGKYTMDAVAQTAAEYYKLKGERV